MVEPITELGLDGTPEGAGVMAFLQGTPASNLSIPQVPLRHSDAAEHRRQIATILNRFLVRTNIQGGFHIGADIASADPLLVGLDGIYFNVTGTTGFASMTVDIGRLMIFRFDGVLTMTNGPSLELPGGVNLVTAAGDHSIMFSHAPDSVRVITYQRAAVAP